MKTIAICTLIFAGLISLRGFAETHGDSVNQAAATSDGPSAEERMTCEQRYAKYNCEGFKKSHPNEASKVIDCATYKEDVLKLIERPLALDKGILVAGAWKPLKFFAWDFPKSEWDAGEVKACRTNSDGKGIKEAMLKPIRDSLEDSMYQPMRDTWTCAQVQRFVTQRTDMMWNALNSKMKPKDEWDTANSDPKQQIYSHYSNLTDREKKFLDSNTAFTPPQMKKLADQFTSYYGGAWQCFRPVDAWEKMAELGTSATQAVAGGASAASALSKASALRAAGGITEAATADATAAANAAAQEKQAEMAEGAPEFWSSDKNKWTNPSAAALRPLQSERTPTGPTWSIPLKDRNDAVTWDPVLNAAQGKDASKITETLPRNMPADVKSVFTSKPEAFNLRTDGVNPSEMRADFKFGKVGQKDKYGVEDHSLDGTLRVGVNDTVISMTDGQKINGRNDLLDVVKAHPDTFSYLQKAPGGKNYWNLSLPTNQLNRFFSDLKAVGYDVYNPNLGLFRAGHARATAAAAKAAPTSVTVPAAAPGEVDELQWNVQRPTPRTDVQWDSLHGRRGSTGTVPDSEQHFVSDINQALPSNLPPQTRNVFTSDPGAWEIQNRARDPDTMNVRFNFAPKSEVNSPGYLAHSKNGALEVGVKETTISEARTNDLYRIIKENPARFPYLTEVKYAKSYTLSTDQLHRLVDDLNSLGYKVYDHNRVGSYAN